MKLFENFSSDSRIWIYQSNRAFTEAEIHQIKNKCIEFTNQWTAHKDQLTASSEIIYKRFIIFCVDENNASASGCSIDKSVHLVKELEKEFNIFLLNRMLVAYINDDKVLSCPLSSFVQLFQSGKISRDTLVFNNNISTLEQLQNNWIIPVKESWIASHLQLETERS
jgi:hypothetical protein